MSNGVKTNQKKRLFNYSAFWEKPFMSAVVCNGFNCFEKLLFMRIASFGVNGCWMSNDSLCAQFNRSESTVSRAITNLWAEGHLAIVNWDGHGRRIYALEVPGVREKLNAECMRIADKYKLKDRDLVLRKLRFRVKPPSA